MSTSTKSKGRFGLKSLNPFSKKLAVKQNKENNIPLEVALDYNNSYSEPVSEDEAASKDQSFQSSKAQSFRPPMRRLNSQSPASEIPANWKEWNAAYLQGKIDFEDPPLPPDTLELSGYTHENGDYLAPRLSSERLRQRALDGLNLLETKKIRPSSLTIPITRKTQEHPALQRLVEKAQALFGVGFAGVNLVDNEYVVFLANVGFDGYEGNPRDATVCAHSLLAGSHEEEKSFVVLDLNKDFRFKDSAKHQGFYASFPITVEPTFGDKSSVSYPVGLLCCMDPKPRKEFSDEDRAMLESLAKEAGIEIARFSQQKKADLTEIRNEKHDEWSEVSIAYGIETLASSDGESSRNNSVTSIPPAYDASNTSPEPNVVNLDISPVFPRRRAVRLGVSAPRSDSVPPALRKVFDLATCLLAETLSFDFVYLLSVDLNPTTSPSQALLMISSHNAPIIPSLFDFQLHLDPLQNASTLLYNNPDYSDEKHIDGTFASGLVLSVGISRNVGYLLGGYSEDKKKVLNHTDFLFFNNFAADLSKHIGRM